MRQLLLEEYYSYDDYLAFDDGFRREIIHGTVYLMAPAALTRHQDVSRALFLQLCNCLEGKTCNVYHAPFEVRLNYD
ncbi:MAG: Uma2 family endonuclease, partial [Clostridiales bacterium]|nr:Uma2 family endonuclease [Clostridiales bacterium]